MPPKVTIRISRRMAREDVTALHSWLERNYPAEWTLSPGEETPETLGITVDILTAVISGATGAVAQELIKHQIDRLRAKYPEDAQPDVEVKVDDQPDEASDQPR